MIGKKDKIYLDVKDTVKPFEFNSDVAEVFDDMVRRSVPGYDESIEILSVVTMEYAQKDTNIYDLGCSLGAAALSISKSLTVNNCKIHAIDNSEAMIKQCRQLLSGYFKKINFDLIHNDIRRVDINNASIVVLNYTLQFIPVNERKNLLIKIYEGLVPGGVLYLSEKIKMPTEDEDELMTSLHDKFKITNGYNELEIAQKRSSLDNVLIRESLSEHLCRLKESGFDKIHELSSQLNFITLLAIKST